MTAFVRGAGILLTAALAALTPAKAQDFSGKPIRMIVGLRGRRRHRRHGAADRRRS